MTRIRNSINTRIIPETLVQEIALKNYMCLFVFWRIYFWILNDIDLLVNGILKIFWIFLLFTLIIQLLLQQFLNISIGTKLSIRTQTVILENLKII